MKRSLIFLVIVVATFTKVFSSDFNIFEGDRYLEIVFGIASIVVLVIIFGIIRMIRYLYFKIKK